MEATYIALNKYETRKYVFWLFSSDKRIPTLSHFFIIILLK